MPKIDAHVHIRTLDETLGTFLNENNFSALTICTRSDSRKYIDEQWKFGLSLRKKYPDQIAVATTFSMENFVEYQLHP